MKEFKFNDFSSQDFNLGILDVKIGAPKPNIIEINIPYHNGSYDYSTVATGGLMTYSNRHIIIDINYISKTKEEMYNLYNKIATSLLGNSSNLEFNYMPGGSFKGRCIQISELSSFISYGKLTITFDCEPFFNKGEFGNYIWDTFNFEKDIAEVKSFTVNTGQLLEIYNEGIIVSPTILASNQVVILVNNTAFTLEKGINNIWGLNLKTGYNEISIVYTAEDTDLVLTFEKNLV